MFHCCFHLTQWMNEWASDLKAQSYSLTTWQRRCHQLRVNPRRRRKGHHSRLISCPWQMISAGSVDNVPSFCVLLQRFEQCLESSQNLNLERWSSRKETFIRMLENDSSAMVPVLARSSWNAVRKFFTICPYFIAMRTTTGTMAIRTSVKVTSR